MKRRFAELPIGTRFCFRARRYEKVAPEIGRDEERGGNVFHAGTEVLVETLPACAPERGRKLVAPAPPALPRLERKRVPASQQHEATLEALRAFCPPDRPPRHGRLGREPDRELGPYGTL